jgi:hypothetical protein
LLTINDLIHRAGADRAEDYCVRPGIFRDGDDRREVTVNRLYVKT